MNTDSAAVQREVVPRFPQPEFPDSLVPYLFSVRNMFFSFFNGTAGFLGKSPNNYKAIGEILRIGTGRARIGGFRTENLALAPWTAAKSAAPHVATKAQFQTAGRGIRISQPLPAQNGGHAVVCVLLRLVRAMRLPNGPLKYAVMAIAAALWLVGLSDQLESYEMTARYLVLSAAMVALATI